MGLARLMPPAQHVISPRPLRSHRFWSTGMADPARSARGAVAGSADDLSAAASAQSPAQSFVPLTVPTSLQPKGACVFACTEGLVPTLGAGGAAFCANALAANRKAAIPI